MVGPKSSWHSNIFGIIRTHESEAGVFRGVVHEEDLVDRKALGLQGEKTMPQGIHAVMAGDDNADAGVQNREGFFEFILRRFPGWNGRRRVDRLPFDFHGGDPCYRNRGRLRGE